MHRYVITISSIEDAIEFITQAEMCNFNITIANSDMSIVLNGKSLIGIFCFIGKPEINVQTDNTSEVFDELMQKFAA